MKQVEYTAILLPVYPTIVYMDDGKTGMQSAGDFLTRATKDGWEIICCCTVGDRNINYVLRRELAP